MKRTLLALAMLLISLTLPLAEAQAPTPPTVSTLGPVILCTAGEGVKIFSPQNQSYSNSPTQLDFSVSAVGMFGQFGNVGYSVDGGIVKSVYDFLNKSAEFAGPDWYWNRTTVFASVGLPPLSEGFHNVTVYYGWQYLGTNNPRLERYEVFAYETVQFTVGNVNAMPIDDDATPSAFASPTPTPTAPEFPTPVAVAFVFAIVLAAALVFKRKQNSGALTRKQSFL